MHNRVESVAMPPALFITDLGFYSPSSARNTSLDSPSFKTYSGRYNYRLISDGPSSEFPKAPRFFGGNLDSIIQHLLSRRKRENSIITKNRECVNQYSNVRKLRLEARSLQQELRIEHTRRAKEQFLTSKHHKLQFNLNEKMRRFNLRCRKAEIIHLKKSWLSLFTLIGSAFIFKKKTQNRKRLHIRAEKSLNWFYQVFKCLGKIRIILQQNRKRRAIRIIRIHMLANIKIWVMRKRNNFRNVTISNIETALTTGMMFNLLAKWKYNILTIQRSMKTLIRARRMVNKFIIDRWNSICISNCSDEIKLIYVRPTIHRSIKAYVELYHEYKNECRELKALNYNEQDRRGLLNKDGILILPKKPLPNTIERLITVDLLKGLVSRAERERITWEKQIAKQEKMIKKTKKKF